MIFALFILSRQNAFAIIAEKLMSGSFIHKFNKDNKIIS